MSTFGKEGYNEEERYFREKEQELLRQKREKIAATEAKHAHWMKCPKCGHDLEEIELGSVQVDRCPNCQGVFLDKGELDQLTSERQSGFFASLRKFFEATSP